MERMMTGRLAGKVALITGAASGIGKAVALLFVKEGASVVMADLAFAAAIASKGELDNPDAYASIALDVGDEAAWNDAVAIVRERYGRLDVLVNNAGIVLPPGPVTQIELKAWRRLMTVNVDGVFLGTRHMLPLMRESGGGSIINVSSIAGIKPSGNASAYAASKGAVRMFTKAVALECAAARDGVRVNSILPGMVGTPIWSDLMGGSDQSMASVAELDALAARAIPMGRMGTADEIANGILWLASDESSYMTGSELVLDGGCVIG